MVGRMIPARAGEETRFAVARRSTRRKMLPAPADAEDDPAEDERHRLVAAVERPLAVGRVAPDGVPDRRVGPQRRQPNTAHASAGGSTGGR